LAEPTSAIFIEGWRPALLVIGIEAWNLPGCTGANLTVMTCCSPAASVNAPAPVTIENGEPVAPTLPLIAPPTAIKLKEICPA
jgi:hypothetical protein